MGYMALNVCRNLLNQTRRKKVFENGDFAKNGQKCKKKSKNILSRNRIRIFQNVF